MWNAVDHFSPFYLMAVLIIGAHVFRHLIGYGRLRSDARRLRAALSTNLRALRILYEDNLGVIAAGGPRLISGRHQIGLLRLHLGRLISLDESEIEAVLTASIAMEQAETAMAIAGKAVAGVAFMVPEEDVARSKIESALLQVCSKLEAAEHLLTSSAMLREERVPADETVIESATHALRSTRWQLPATLAQARSSARVL